MHPTEIAVRSSVLISTLLSSGARQALKVISPTEVLQATRLSYRGRFLPRNGVHVVLTAGRPNYLARRFIKACKKAGEPFPVKKIQLRFPAKRKRG